MVLRSLIPLVSLLLTLNLAACLGSGDTSLSRDEPFPFGLADSPEGEAVLDLLNFPRTTVELLRDDALLPEAVATELLLVRDGADGLRHSPDDELFGSIREVANVPGVDDEVLLTLLAYAEEHGWADYGDRELKGIYEHVAFAVVEAEAVVDLANNAKVDELDERVGLYSSAAANIVALRPFDNIAQVAAVPEVGPASLRLLRDAAMRGPVAP